MKKTFILTLLLTGFLLGEVFGAYDVIPDKYQPSAFGGTGSGFAPTKYNSVTTTNFGSGTIASASVTLLAKESNRNWVKCYNNGTARVWVELGATAAKDASSFPISASGSFELNFNENPYIGVITGVLDSDLGSTSVNFTCSQGKDILTTY